MALGPSSSATLKRSDDPIAPTTTMPEGTSSADFTPRTLLRRSVPVLIAIVVLILIALLAPGLGEVRDLLAGADPGWIAVAIGFEALSFASYIVMFAPIFCRGMSWSRSWQIGGSELAMGSLVPASGAGGLALGAWVLHEGGMERRPDRPPLGRLLPDQELGQLHRRRGDRAR